MDGLVVGVIGAGVMGIGAGHRAVTGQALVFNKARQLGKDMGFFLDFGLVIGIIKGVGHHAVAPLSGRADVLAVVL